MIDIKHITKLANLDLSESEQKDYTSKLEDTIKFIETLKKIKTEKIPPTSQVGGQTNHWREDKIDTSRILPPGKVYKAKLSWT